MALWAITYNLHIKHYAQQNDNEIEVRMHAMDIKRACGFRNDTERNAKLERGLIERH